MAYIHVYSTRINWENEPSITSPINATNLNKMDYALKAMDDTFGSWDITKANESDLLLALKDVSYDTDTGVFVFTWFNGTTSTIDLNIEKIPVSFSMDANGVITMTTEDGTTYTADVGALIKTYTFTDSSVIDFTVTTDASGNKTVTADIVNGAIDGTKLTPNYLADCTQAKTGAETAATNSATSSQNAEAWAVGTRGGVPVPSTDPAYENNAEYWAHHTSASLAGLNDVNISNPQDKQALTYDANTGEWINGAAAGGGTASDITYDNTTSGLSATDVQDAIDEVDAGAIKWSEATTSVKKNLLKNTATSTTINGVTFTVNADGSITVNGTATAEANFYILSENRGNLLPNYNASILSGCPSGGTINTYFMYIGQFVNNVWELAFDFGDGANVTFNSSRTLDNSVICVRQGVTVSNKTFYPMLRLASIADDTYVPYIKDNVELTRSMEDVQSIDLSSIVTASAPLFEIVYAGVVLRNGIAVLSLRVKCLMDVVSATGYDVVTGLPYIPLGFDNKNIECIGRNITQDNIGVMAWFSGSTPGRIDTTGGTMAGTLLAEDDVISFTAIYPYVVNS